ncbi:MAG: hypothetical protein KKA64_04860 [Nanoarchaeota archaeon]|nr:hypothetical protein [Nanoarchaeota archaeon]
MIFNINLIKEVGAERLLFNIVSMYPHSFGGIISVVDTGSPRTIISAGAVFKLKMPITGEKALPICGFGRGSIPCRKVDKFKFIIKSSEGKMKSIEMPVYVVDIPALNNLSQEMKLSAYQIDTIIGLDFLISQKMKLVVDFNNNLSYFEEI